MRVEITAACDVAVFRFEDWQLNDKGAPVARLVSAAPSLLNAAQLAFDALSSIGSAAMSPASERAKAALDEALLWTMEGPLG